MPDLSIAEIKKRLTKLLPDDNFRKICLAHFVESINEAHSYGQNKWGIYFDDKCVRLLVGNLIICTIHEKAIWITLDKQSLTEFKDKYHSITNSEFWQWDTGDYSEYNPIPSKPIASMNGFYFPSDNDLNIWPIIRELHFNYIKKM